MTSIKKPEIMKISGHYLQLKNALLVLIVLILPAYIISSCSDSSSSGNKEQAGLHPDPDNGGLQVPKGFGALVVAENVGEGRKLAIRDNGDIYLSLRHKKNGGGIAALRDTTGDGKADIISYFGDYPGDGIEIYHGYLYFSSDTAVLRYKFTSKEQLLPDRNPEIIARGFPVQHQHQVKPFAFDMENHIYVNVGAPSNACMEQTRTPGSPGMDPCPQLERHAGIWRFDAEKTGQTQVDDGYRYATGIRNAVALAWNYTTNYLYLVQHGRDQLHQLFPDLYTEDQGVNLPAEEFFLVKDGSNFGWPYCFYDPQKKKKVLAPEYGGDGSKAGICSDMVNPILAFPAHLAPNDLMFYTGNMFPERFKNGAFIAFHGSWNRAPQEQKGYYVVFVPFNNEVPEGGWEIFADNFAKTDKIISPGDAKYRPTGLTQGSDGSVYITESNTGKIWRVLYEGK